MKNSSYLDMAKRFIEENPDLFKEPQIAFQPRLDESQETSTIPVEDEEDIPFDSVEASEIKSCRTCNGTRFWRSKFGGHLVCPKCHPPTSENEVAEWIGEECN